MGKDKKKVIVFISALEKDLEYDKNKIYNFMNKLNDDYEEDEIRFELREYYDEDEFLQGDYIKNSEIVVVLLAKKYNLLAKKEFDFALNSYNKNDSPKIIVYLNEKYINEQEDSLIQFKDELLNKINHYYGSYVDADTVLLMLMQVLSKIASNYIKFNLTKDGVFCNGKKLCSCDALSEFYNNEELNALKKQLRKVANDYDDAFDIMRKNPDDYDIKHKVSMLADQKQNLIKQIDIMQDRTVEMVKDMLEKTTQGKLSKRQIQGYQLLEQGKINEANKLLDYDIIMLDIKAGESDREIAKSMEKVGVKKIEDGINELMLKIKTLKLLGDTVENINEQYKIFEKIEEITEKNKLDFLYQFKYGEFLFRQNRYSEAENMLKKAKSKQEKLLNIQNIATNKIDIENLVNNNPENLVKDYADCLFMLSSIYKQKEDKDKLLINILFATEIRQKLFEKYPSINNALSIINSLNKISNIYRKQYSYNKAIEIEKMIYGILKESFNGTSNEFVIRNLCNLAELSFLIKKNDDAEKLCYEALEKLEFADCNDVKKEYWKSLISNNLASVYEDNKNYLKAEEFYSKSLLLQRKLVDINPEANTINLIITLKNLANVYEKMKNYQKAEDLLNESEEKLIFISKQNQEFYVKQKISIYISKASLYCETKEYEKSKKYLSKAMELAEQLYQKSTTNAIYIPLITYNLAYLYKAMKRYKLAEELYSNALDMYNQIYKVNANVVKNKIILCLKDMIEIYQLTGNTKERFNTQMLLNKIEQNK